MEEILMNNDLDIIYSRMEKLFKRISRTRYWILVNNDPYDQSYNFFFNSQRQGERLKSVPLHKLINYDLSYLEQVIKGLRSKTNLTIEFTGFAGMKWPSTQKVIQWRREQLE
ncbi:acetyl-CoA carboxylase [Lentilactobacillus hilgardii]|jgi:hypothetical protein|nr:acetyl-CoA carboxylase [Lentilactobacillus hilgardii]MCP9350260.1 acetyl-CoA carboxylase [Lentilactobacillus hilgardii]MCP9353136.1 acetyl-CoA carboxylase [Lentilactobacillus hilgardii]QEU39747.1 acetyl-CoA carboxylase [Lentilactobacillus hilgardii]